MDERPLNDELGEFLRALRARWYIPVAVVAQFAVLAYLLTSLQTPMYRASATVLLEPTAAEQALDSNVSNAGLRGRNMTNELNFAKSGEVLASLMEVVGFDDPNQLEQRLNVSGDAETDFLVFNASDPDAANAATIANAWASLYIERKRTDAATSLESASATLTQRLADLQASRNELRAQLNSLLVDKASSTTQEGQARFDALIVAEQERIASQDDVLGAQIDSTSATIIQFTVARDLAVTGTARVVSAAVAPPEPSNVAPARNTAIGIILGLIVGLLAVRMLGRRDDRVSTANEVEVELRLPVLAAIPGASRSLRQRGELGIAAAEAPGELFSEAFNQLRTSINFLQGPDERKPLVVTSASPAEGKTTVAANMSIVMAMTGTPTTLIDLDLRRPRVHEVFSVNPSPGITDFVLGDATYDQTLIQFENLPLRLIAAGGRVRNVVNILSHERTADCVHRSAETSGIVVIDTPPVLAVSDAASIAAATGSMAVLVIRAGSTTHSEAREAMKRLERVGCEVIGVILTGVKRREGSGRSYYGNEGRSVEGTELVVSRRIDSRLPSTPRATRPRPPAHLHESPREPDPTRDPANPVRSPRPPATTTTPAASASPATASPATARPSAGSVNTGGSASGSSNKFAASANGTDQRVPVKSGEKSPDNSLSSRRANADVSSTTSRSDNTGKTDSGKTGTTNQNDAAKIDPGKTDTGRPTDAAKTDPGKPIDGNGNGTTTNEPSTTSQSSTKNKL